MPIEITLAQNDVETYILAFDGRVVELFESLSAGKTRRYHAAMLAAIGLTTDKKGNHTLVLEFATGYQEMLIVTESKLPVVNQLVAEVQQAMANDR